MVIRKNYYPSFASPRETSKLHDPSGKENPKTFIMIDAPAPRNPVADWLEMGGAKRLPTYADLPATNWLRILVNDCAWNLATPSSLGVSWREPSPLAMAAAP